MLESVSDSYRQGTVSGVARNSWSTVAAAQKLQVHLPIAIRLTLLLWMILLERKCWRMVSSELTMVGWRRLVNSGDSGLGSRLTTEFWTHTLLEWGIA